MRVLQIAAVVSATILSGFALWALRPILEPFVLALFLLIMIDGLARALRLRVPTLPSWVALTIAFALIVAVFGLALWLAIDNAAAFASQSAAYTARLNALLQGAAQILGLKVTPTVADLIHRVNPARYAGVLAAAVSRFAEGSVFVFIYLGFLVASRRGFAAKAREMFSTEGERAKSTEVFERVRHGVERYIWVQTVVGVIITALSAVLMLATGLSHIGFWCLVIFLFNYIPAIGAAIGVLFPVVFGLVEFDGYTRALILLVGLEAIHFAVSHVVQPRMQGRSLNLDPIVILLALASWGAVWGVVGAFLSTPLTVMTMAILAEFRSTRPLAVLLSSDGKPYGQGANAAGDLASANAKSRRTTPNRPRGRA